VEKKNNKINNNHIYSMMDTAINDIVERLAGESIDFEIVGLHCGSSNRNCCAHEICGVNVVKGDLLRLVSCVVEISGKGPEEAISLVKLDGETHTCTVAFIPRAFLEMPSIVDRIGTVAIVEELYSESPNTFKRRLSNKNLGMAACRFIQVYGEVPNNYE
jgi:hypothetical protein